MVEIILRDKYAHSSTYMFYGVNVRVTRSNARIRSTGVNVRSSNSRKRGK